MRNFYEEILTIIIEMQDLEELKEALEQYHESDIADVLQTLEEPLLQKVIDALEDNRLSDIFEYLADPLFLQTLPPKKIAEFFEGIDSNIIMEMIEPLEEEKQEEIIAYLDPKQQSDIDYFQAYDEEQIVRYMTANFVTIQQHDSVKQAMKKVIQEAEHHDNIMTIYVLDQEEKYYGVLDLVDLIIARENDKIEGLIKKSYPFTYFDLKVEDCANQLQDYDLESFPVLDYEKHLVGIITKDTLIKVVDEKKTEDYARLAAVSEEEIFGKNIFFSMKKRLPWLLILLGLSTAISLFISRFEAVLLLVPILAFFQSLVLDMAGNVGTQSLAVTIQHLNDEKHGKKETKKLVMKETNIGFLNSIFSGIIAFIVVLFFLWIRKDAILHDHFQIQDALLVASLITISFLGAMTASSFFGSLIPVIFKKLKIDPAVASGPFITTLNDFIAVLFYYGLATLLLHMIGFM